MRFLRQAFGAFFLVLSFRFGAAPAASAQGPSPITLEEAIASARKHHPEMAIAQAAEEQARAARKAAASGRLPTITAAEDALYSNDPVFVFGSKLRQGRFSSSDFDPNALNHPVPLSDFSASVSANWTAFDAGAARSRVESASSSVVAAELQSRYTEEKVTASVTALYYRVLLAEDQIAVADAALKRDQEVASDVGDRVRAGLSLESDGARANLALEGAQNDAAAARDHVKLARGDFFRTIGEASTDRPLQRPVAESFPSEEGEVVEVPADRFDLQAVRMEQRSAQEMLRSAKATAWPQISMFGRVQNDAEYVVSSGSGNWTIGAKIQINVFDGGARKSRELEALANIGRLAAQERATRLEADSNISALNTEIADLRRRMSTAEGAIDVQEAALQTLRDRYSNGLVSITEVLNGESDLSSAEFLRVRTFYQLCIANAELELATGQQTTKKAGQR